MVSPDIFMVKENLQQTLTRVVCGAVKMCCTCQEVQARQVEFLGQRHVAWEPKGIVMGIVGVILGNVIGNNHSLGVILGIVGVILGILLLGNVMGIFTGCNELLQYWE